MNIEIDHIILKVNDATESTEFYERILGFAIEAPDGPFSVVRVSDSFTLQMAPWGTAGGEHLAFSMSRAQFEVVFSRLRDHEIPYGNSFHSVGNQLGPGEELGARGMGRAVYFFDPNKHLLEIRHYEQAR